LHQPIKHNSPTSSAFYEATAYEARGSKMETTEITPLLSNASYEEHEGAQATFTHQNGSKLRYPQPHHVLLIAFLAALAISSTAATGYYAYATLLCKDARHCNGDEARTYKKFIAATISISNVPGMIALGPLQKISRSHRNLVCSSGCSPDP